MHYSGRLNILHWLLPMAVLLSLQGCGFHPRGQAVAPAPQLSPILVSGLAAHHGFYRELTHQLEMAGMALSREELAASTLLQIHSQKTDRRVLSVNARNKTVEYEIEESLEYSIQRPPGAPVGKHLFLSANRILFNSGIQVLGRDREETLLREDMYKQLARLLINQLAAIR
jgi:LPS-assembly lipoprotein